MVFCMASVIMWCINIVMFERSMRNQIVTVVYAEDLGFKPMPGSASNDNGLLVLSTTDLSFEYDSRQKQSPKLEFYTEEGVEGKGNHSVFNLKDSSSKECIAKDEWQMRSFPTCNSVHEVGGDILFGANNLEYARRGGTLDIWFGLSDWGDAGYSHEEKFTFKTQRLLFDRPNFLFSRNQFESQRKGAVALERLTASPYVVNIYGFCGMSTVNEFLSTSLNRYLKDHGEKRLKRKRLLRLAKEAIQGLYDAHYILGEYKNPTIVHNDIALSNFMLSSTGHLVLNDFNGSFFIAKNITSGYNCEVYRAMGRGNCPRGVSPEKCKNDVYINEKVDIFHFGIVLEKILKNRNLNKFWELDDALRAIVNRCKALDPYSRPSSEELLQLVNQMSDEIETQQIVLA